MQTQSEKFYAWLESQRPKPPSQKEINRIVEAMRIDLAFCVKHGYSKENRISIFKSLGYFDVYGIHTSHIN